jgi:diketogulonate reductase-like aldo/keto reductase
MEYTTLNNGVRMPMLGFGVWQVAPRATERHVRDAIGVGYRSIDTAQCYGNEGAVGDAVIASGVPREQMFLTTKVWTDGYDSTRRSIDASLSELSSDYVDLLLIHQPGRDNPGTYRAMEQAHQAGKARAIGLSNFYSADFSDIADSCEVVPAVNQVETHVFWQQRRTRELLSRYGTQLESWAPFAEGMHGMFTNPVLARIGEQYRKSVAQTILRFFVQSGVVVIPKTTHKDRMIENFQVFDFSLSEQDMEQITALDTDRTHFGWPARRATTGCAGRSASRTAAAGRRAGPSTTSTSSPPPTTGTGWC